VSEANSIVLYEPRGKLVHADERHIELDPLSLKLLLEHQARSVFLDLGAVGYPPIYEFDLRGNYESNQLVVSDEVYLALAFVLGG
jgi:hypothetical protein